MNKEKYIPGKKFKIDTGKIKTLEDVKLILDFMNLNFTPTSRSAYEKTKHLLRDENE